MDTSTKERRVYKLPQGFWENRKEDEWTLFYSADLGSLPYWSFKNHGNLFGFRDFQAVMRAPLSLKGMKSVLNQFGPWDLKSPPIVGREDSVRESTELSYAEWHFHALKLKRANSLWQSLRRGDVPTWEMVKRGTLPFLRITSWPKSLTKSIEGEPEDALLDFSYPMTRQKADYCDDFTARKLAKELLSIWIAEELRSIRFGFLYDFQQDRFLTDVGEEEVLDLRVACWLIVRDLISNLAGLRFCQAPGCKQEIPRTKRSHATTCGRGRCQKELYRKRKGGSSHGEER